MVADPDGHHASTLWTAPDLCVVYWVGSLHLFAVLTNNLHLDHTILPGAVVHRHNSAAQPAQSGTAKSLAYGDRDYCVWGYLFHQGVLGLYYSFARGSMTVIQSLSDLGLTVVALVTTLVLARVSWVYFEPRLGKRAHQ